MRYDIVVVGGGLLGLFAALETLETGYRVAIVEKDILCSGSCSRSTGVVTKQLALRADIAFVDRSIRIIRDLEKRLGGVYFKRRGVLTINSIGRVLRRLELIYRSSGVGYKLLDPYEIKSMWNILKVGDREVGILTEDDGILDIGSLSYALRREIDAMGGDIYEMCGEARLKRFGNTITGVISSREDCWVEGDTFILNVGVNTSKLYRESLGLDPKPQQRFLLCQSLALEFGSSLEAPIVYDNTTHLYIVPEAGRRAIVGDGPCEVVDRPEDTSASQHILEEVIEDLAARVEGSESAKLVEIIHGVCDLSHDFLPFVGKDKLFENLYLAYGLSTYGTMRSPYLGIQLARMAVGKKADPEVRVLGARGGRGIDGCWETHTPIMPRSF